MKILNPASTRGKPMSNRKAYLQTRLLAFGSSGSPVQGVGDEFKSSRPILPLASYIDHTQLASGSDEATIAQLCQEARQHRFFAVCIRPSMISKAKSVLLGSHVKVATVIGFPNEKRKLQEERGQATIGDIPLKAKKMETVKAVQDNADEIDLVMNVRQFLRESNHPVKTMKELKAIRALTPGKVLKVIIETDLLNENEIRQATLTCAHAGADFVKTSTGMLEGGVGATVNNVKLMRKTLDQAGFIHVEIKASGGINIKEQALALIDAGATRLGASKGIQLVTDETPTIQSDY